MKKLVFLLFPVTLIGCQSAVKESAQSNTTDLHSTKSSDSLSIESIDSISLDNIIVIQEFILLVSSRNIDKISEKVKYPLRRKYPIPPVTNKKEFVERFHEIFDDSLLQEISDMKKMTKWSELTEDEIMFDNGKIWIDSQGYLIAVNRTSNLESETMTNLINMEKSMLHKSIKQFEQPVLEMKTKSYQVRIDDLGDFNYRYASWSKGKSYSDEPDLVVLNGEQIIEGSGGNHSYKFTNGNYKYICSIIRIGKDDDPPARITIFQNEKEIHSEDATILID